MKTKKEHLLLMKEAIEKECDKHTLPLATIHGIMEVFDELLMGKVGAQTITSEVANWYKQFDFIKVSNKGIGFAISF